MVLIVRFFGEAKVNTATMALCLMDSRGRMGFALRQAAPVPKASPGQESRDSVVNSNGAHPEEARRETIGPAKTHWTVIDKTVKVSVS